MTNNTATIEFYQLLILIIFTFIATLLFTSFYINKWTPFKEGRDYLRMEIARTEGDKQKYYKRKLRRHYLRLIPFAGRFVNRD